MPPEESEIPSGISIHLREVMEARGMTSVELSARIGLTEANISRLRTGKVVAVRFSTLGAICEALECQPGDILTYEAARVENPAP